eukprot:RCo015521
MYTDEDLKSPMASEESSTTTSHSPCACSPCPCPPRSGAASAAAAVAASRSSMSASPKSDDGEDDRDSPLVEDSEGGSGDGGLYFSPATLELLQAHIAEAERDAADLLNEGIPARIARVQEVRAASGAMSLAEKQRVLSELHCDALKVLDSVGHWITMKEEKLECGNEFGSEVQATVLSTINSCAGGLTDKKEALTTNLTELLALNIEKYSALRETEAHKVLIESHLMEYSAAFERLLELMLHSYRRIQHVIRENREALVDPKNRRGQDRMSGHENSIFS